MNDTFATWREAVSGGCHPISGDEVCAGYYSVPSSGVRLEKGTNPEQMDQALSKSWLPVALWIDEESGQLTGLLDGEEVNPSVIWPLCRQSPVPYEAYRAVAELGQDWPAFQTGRQFSHENQKASDEDLRLIGTRSFQDRIAPPSNAETFAQSGKEFEPPENASFRMRNHAQYFPVEAVSLTLKDPDAIYSPAGVYPDVFNLDHKNLGVLSSEVTVQTPNDLQKETVRHQNSKAGRTGLSDAEMSGPLKSGATHHKTLHRHPLPTDHAPPGHNQQSVGRHEILAEMLADLGEECETWLEKTGQINNQDTANQAGHFAERYSALEKEAEEARTLEKRPALELGRAIDGKWKPIVTAAAEGKKCMKRAVEPFLIAERLRMEEEARAEGLLTSAPVAPKAGLYGRKVGLRASYVMQINKEAALIEAFHNDQRLWRDPEVRLAIKRLAEADLRAGRDVDGAELVQELTAA